MSSTNRGAVRETSDFYPTPASAINPLLDRLSHRLMLCGSDWVEPCAGNGQIIRVVDQHAADKWTLAGPAWTAIELRQEANVALIGEEATIHCPQDFLKYNRYGKFDVCITNPPFILAQQFIEHSFKVSKCTIMLLRLNFLGSKERIAFHRKYPADIYVLPRRPNFMKGERKWSEKKQKMVACSGDSCEYGWFVWGLGKGGSWEILEA